MFRRGLFRRAFVLLGGTLALAACVQSPPPGGAGVYQPGPASLGPSGGAPAAVRGVALLAPLTGPNAERGQALVNAAKLALNTPDSPKLDVQDTGGTPAGAATAARQAIAGGAALIIGPLTAGETAAAGDVARAAGIPVLAFTNDPAQAKPGVWTLGITPGQQVRRMVGAEMAQQKTRFAAVLPRGDFGNAMSAALNQALSSAGVPPASIQTYDPSPASIDAAVRGLANYAGRAGPVMDQIRAAREQRDAAGREQAAALSSQGLPPPSFDALLLADTGDRLATITALVSSYEVGPPNVRIMGPALWAVPQARGAASLDGAWYAAPESGPRAGFDQQYTTQYGSAAPGIADFAFDAASLARALAQGGYSVASLTRPDGFAGVDGVFVLQPDGTVRRGLALFEIRGGSPQMLEPAPTRLGAPGI